MNCVASELVMDMRELKGLEIAARTKLVFADGAWMVPSQSSTTVKYRVTLNPVGCTCDDFSLRQQPCKHVHAARLVQERDHGGRAPIMDMDAIPVRPTYKQVWSAYNLAQSTEKDRFQVLLNDLCRGIQEPERPTKPGPKPHLLRDVVFAAALKIYVGFSSRRSSCDFDEAHRRGFTTKSIPGMKVNSFLENAELTPILKMLIAQSARPLRIVEQDFAIDSTGFSSSKFETWYDQKYGVTRRKCAWVKAHVAVGVKTNVVTAVRILDKDAGDCPQYDPLTKQTAENFTIREMSADKAYSSLEAFELVAGFGGTAYIPFKSNATGGVGGLFEKMFHYFQFRREEFLTHYHKRSNVESTFSAVKRKFGDAVRSKTETAMVNEVLCKFLCHNICCLIQEQCELGIEPVFWQNEATPVASQADTQSTRLIRNLA
jgi:transposase